MDKYEKLVRHIAKDYNVSLAELTGPGRDHDIVLARAAVSYLLKRYYGLSYAKIGGLLGGRDHTTIMNLVKIARKDPPEMPYSTEVNTPGFTHAIGHEVHKWRREILERVGFKCEFCGFNEVVELHHIISPKQGGSLKDPINIVVVCPNHHALLHAGMVFVKDTARFKDVDKQA